LTRLSEYDRRAITIETGIQNSGLGLVLIFAFFGGLGGMAVAAAFWGIWHAISGLALAAVWSRREARR
jgi:BASS family bile acid:Na+ symporter